MDSNQKSGFILLIGETNSGKSTFINAAIGDKVSIVSRKVQTTRTRILGILTEDNYQLVFIDTPGIFKPRRGFDRQLIETSLAELEDSDIIILFIDAKKGITEHSSKIISKFPKNKKIICAINKIDLMNKEDLLQLSEKASKLYDFDKFFMISALKKQGIKDMISYLKENLHGENFLFDEDQISDVPVNQLATEITREQVYNFLHQELPYNITVESISWQETENKIIIHHNIMVAKQNYKAIVLGSQGEKIGQIRINAENEMRKIFGKDIDLHLYVKVDKNILKV